MIIMKLSIYYHIWAPANEPLVRFLIDEQIKRLQLHSLTNQAKLNVVIVGKAAKDIEPGEELTLRYTMYNLDLTN